MSVPLSLEAPSALIFVERTAALIGLVIGMIAVYFIVFHSPNMQVYRWFLLNYLARWSVFRWFSVLRSRLVFSRSIWPFLWHQFFSVRTFRRTPLACSGLFWVFPQRLNAWVAPSCLDIWIKSIFFSIMPFIAVSIFLTFYWRFQVGVSRLHLCLIGFSLSRICSSNESMGAHLCCLRSVYYRCYPWYNFINGALWSSRSCPIRAEGSICPLFLIFRIIRLWRLS